jgi:hypothetical protein
LDKDQPYLSFSWKNLFANKVTVQLQMMMITRSFVVQKPPLVRPRQDGSLDRPIPENFASQNLPLRQISTLLHCAFLR